MVITWWLLAVESAQPLIRRLGPELRGRVILALVGLVLLGATLILFAWLGARHVRRLARNRPPLRPREVSDWDRREPAFGNEDRPPRLIE